LKVRHRAPSLRQTTTTPGETSPDVVPPNAHDTRLRSQQPPHSSMNTTSTITTNADHSMKPSEASGKRKASDDNNSQNHNNAPKAKRTRKDVSGSSSLSVSSFIYSKRHGTECRLPQTETYAIPPIFVCGPSIIMLIRPPIVTSSQRRRAARRSCYYPWL
jgi:hypothetical protein